MASETKAKASLKSHVVNKHQWWYEDRGGVQVVSQAIDEKGRHVATTITRITWRKLLEAAKRCGR